MSQHLDKMVLGDCILAKGPKGRFTYARNMKRHIGAPAAALVQNVTRLPAKNPAPCACHCKYFLHPSFAAGMVAGGTGITPMWQVANHILSDGLAERMQVSCPVAVEWASACRPWPAGERAVCKGSMAAKDHVADELVWYCPVAEGG